MPNHHFGEADYLRERRELERVDAAERAEWEERERHGRGPEEEDACEPMNRIACALIGHHKWPERYDGNCLRCGSEGQRPGRWRQYSPLHWSRGRWHLSITIGWHWLISVKVSLALRQYGHWNPGIDASVTLWRLEVSAWALGFEFVDEDGERRSLAGVSATVNTYGAARLVCRLFGHNPCEPFQSGSVYCARCSEDLTPAELRRERRVA